MSNNGRKGRRGDRRLLLLEFVTHERWVFESRLYPLFKGAFEELGGEARWLCFGAEISVLKVGPQEVRQRIDLGEEDLATLSRHFSELEPTHVIMSHSVSEAVLEVLRSGQNAPALASVSDHRAPEGVEGVWLPETVEAQSPEQLRMSESDQRIHEKLGGSLFNWSQSRTDWLLTWMGETEESTPHFGKYLLGTFAPTYDAIMANAQATTHAPHLLIAGGVTCDHFRPVGTNPHFDGIDLSGCDHDHGCSYCTWYRGPTSDLHEDPVAVAEMQLRRVVETVAKEGRHCGFVDILDIRLFSQIERFTEMVLSIDLPPTTFCFEPRIDRLVQVADSLRRALPKLGERGHRIYLFRMGAENLIEEENELFNKFVTLKQIDEGSLFLKEFSEAFPDSFECDPTWGYITCSPWTTLDMLETGIERAIERGFEPMGVWLYTPVLFYRGSPMTKLAESQGDILLPSFEDLSLLYEAAVNNVSIDTFLPWRFRDERTGAAFALHVRFCAAAMRDKYPDSIFDGDALYDQIRGWEQDHLPFDRPDLFALEAVRAVRASKPPWDFSALAQEALGPYREKVEAALAQERMEQTGRQQDAGESNEEDFPQAPPEDPRVAAEQRRARMLHRLAVAVQERMAPDLENLSVLETLPISGKDSLSLVITIDGQRYELRLDDPADGGPCFFRTEHFLVSYVKETPLTEPAHQRTVKQFIQAIDRVATRHAPYALPQGPQQAIG